MRLVYLQVIVAPSYASQAEQARTVGFDIEPRRGTIYDRNGTVLAVSVDATTIYANPSEVEDLPGTAAALAGVLGGEAADYQNALSAGTSTFAFIQRKADTAVADQVRALDLKGIYFIADTKRTYPNGRVGAQIVGLTDIDGNGLSGLEKYYDDILSGEPGRYEAERGRDGTPIPGGVHEETPAVDGQDIIISVDIELQQYVDRLLADKEARTSNGAAPGGSSRAPSSNRCRFHTRARPSWNGHSGTMTPDTELFCPSSIEADGLRHHRCAQARRCHVHPAADRGPVVEHRHLAGHRERDSGRRVGVPEPLQQDKRVQPAHEDGRGLSRRR